MRRTLIALSLALAAATPALAQDFPPPPPVGEPKPFRRSCRSRPVDGSEKPVPKREVDSKILTGFPMHLDRVMPGMQAWGI